MEKKKILIVEDEDMISSMYKTKLEQEGYLVEIAVDGAEGVEKGQADDYDLILLDVIMPMMDGFSALEALREKGKSKKSTIIMTTNLGTEEDIAKAKTLGADDYVVKASLTPTQLAEKIKQYIK